MKTICLHDKPTIESFLCQDVYKHIYSIGNLDDFFWPHTTWYALKEQGIKEIVLMTYVYGSPFMLAFEQNNNMKELLKSIIPLLPCEFYAHLSPGLDGLLKGKYELKLNGKFYRMASEDKSLIKNIDTSSAVRLSKKDLNALLDLYEVSYPHNYFNPKKLENNPFFGIWEEGKLISVAGTSIYSPKYKVAAIGNVATHPSKKYIRKGHATTVISKLSKFLLEKGITHTCGNIFVDNIKSINCVKKLGSKPIGEYGEFGEYEEYYVKINKV